MNENKILVVYFSRSGNTRKVAEEVARTLNADIQEIKSKTTYSMGFRGYQRALFDAIFKKKAEIIFSQTNLSKYELVVIGTPVWGGAVSSPVRSFLDNFKGQLNEVAFFTTQGGQGQREHVLEQMKDLSGKLPKAVMSLSLAEIKNDSFKKGITEFASDLKFKSKPARPRTPPESFVAF